MPRPVRRAIPNWIATLACPVLINTITSMVLISIHPFGTQKILLAIVALLCFSALCFADPVLLVRRSAFQAEQLTTPRVSVSSWREPTGERGGGIVDPFHTNSGSIDLLARQPGSASNDGGSTCLQPAVPSSVFRNASCARRSTGSPTAIHHRSNLPGPANLVAL